MSRFANCGQIWHLCTPGNKTELLFVNPEDYAFCVSSIGVCAHLYGVEILADIVMSNHIHIIARSEIASLLSFFDGLKKKLQKYFKKNGRTVCMSGFDCGEPIQITSLDMLRTEIVYVARNAYVARNDVLPHTYPWGSCYLLFNHIVGEIQFKRFNDLPYREKRRILLSRVIELPDNYVVSKGMIHPVSYCHFEEVEGYFRNAHHYFSMLTRNYEAYSQEAIRLGDSQVLTDEEMYYAVCEVCSKQYNTKSPGNLALKDKSDVAKVMHSDYNATNGQIQRILRMDINFVNSLFPSTAKR